MAPKSTYSLDWLGSNKMGHAKQIVTATEYKVLQEVREDLNFLKGCDYINTLVYPKLSILKVEDNIKPLRILDWRVTFLLVDRPKENIKMRPVAIVRVLDNHSPRMQEAERSIGIYIRRICQEIKVDYCVYEEVGDDSVRRVEYLDCYDGKEHAGASEAFNYAQYRCAVSFCPDTKTNGGEELYLCHEPSLDSFLDLQDAKEITKRINSENPYSPTYDKKIDFFNQASVDALVCLGMPNGIPLFGIEFDGKTHNSPKSIMNDRAKNELFKANNLPLLRVKSDVFNSGITDLNRYCDFNSIIGRSLTEDILKKGHFLKLLVYYLKREAERVGLNHKIGNNISFLANKVDEFFERQNNSMQLLSSKVDYWDVQASYGDSYEAISKEFNDLANFGTVPNDIKHIWKEKGLTVTLEFAPGENERKVIDIKTFSCGPYNIVDATSSYDFRKILSSLLEECVRTKAYETLSYGSPSIKDKLHLIQRQIELERKSHNKRVNHFACSYLANVIFWVQSCASDSESVKAPATPLQNIDLRVLQRLPDNEREQLINELTKIHEILVENNVARFLFEKNDFSPTAWIHIARSLGNKSLLELIQNSDEWRLMMKPIREKISRDAKNRIERNTPIG
jgi:hypothetical protein